MKTNTNINDNKLNTKVKKSPKWEDFLFEESESKDTVDFKKIYVDMAGSVKAGLMLSQIIYWYLPGQTDTKLRVKKKGSYWLAKRRYDWWDEIRLTPKEVDNATLKLEEAGLIKTKIHRFNNLTTVHIQLNIKLFLEKFSFLLSNPLKNPFLPFEPKIPLLPKGEKQDLPKSEKQAQNPAFTKRLKAAFTKRLKALTETTKQRLQKNNNTVVVVKNKLKNKTDEVRDTSKEEKADIVKNKPTLQHHTSFSPSGSEVAQPITSLSEPIVTNTSTPEMTPLSEVQLWELAGEQNVRLEDLIEIQKSIIEDVNGENKYKIKSILLTLHKWLKYRLAKGSVHQMGELERLAWGITNPEVVAKDRANIRILVERGIL